MTHTRRTALIVLAAFAGPVFCTLTAFGANLVSNGDLETASSNASIPSGWSTNKWGSITAQFSYPVAGNGSARAAKVQVTKRSSGDAKWVFSHIPVEAGKVYEYSDDYSSNKVSQVTVEYLLQNGSFDYVWLGSAPSTGGAWQKFTQQFTAPANAVSMCVIHSLEAVGTLTIDNVAVLKAGDTEPPPPPPPGDINLIVNGNLEAGSGSTPTGWSKDNWGNLKATYSYPVTGANGGKGAKVVVTSWKSGDAKWRSNSVAVSSSTIYRFTNDYNATVPTEVTAEFEMSDGSYRYEWVGSAPATAGAWNALAIEITVPRGAVALSVLHLLDKNGTLTIDNASLVALPANPFAEGMVTFVFDDGLSSQYNNARPILNTAGIKSTYAIITQQVGGGSNYMTWTNVTGLKGEANEISAHSRTHPDLTTLSSTAAQQEIQGSYDDLVAQSLTPNTFVYPVGGVDPNTIQRVKNAGFVGARASFFGLNSPTAEKYALYDIRLDKTTTLASAKELIDQAIADKRWLVFELHDVVGSGGDDLALSTSLFQSIVNYVKQTGIKTVTLQQGLQSMAP